ncbi:MAG: hypothetical protein ACOCV2_15090, partial [Persicimonas sp.]
LEAFDEVSRLRSRLAEVHRRIERSAVDLFELREERAQLEERLEAVFARAGAIVYDRHMRGEGFDLEAPLTDRAMGSDDEPAASAKEEPSDEKPADEVGDEPRSDEAPEDEAPLAEAAASEPPAPSEAREEADEAPLPEQPDEVERATERAPEPSSHQVYMRTARILPTVRRKLGAPPDDIDSYPDVIEELGKLKRATQPKALGRWSQLPDEVQRCLIAYVAARMRHLQDEIPGSLASVVSEDERVPRFFSRLKTHVDTYRPGFVHGLARAHEPQTTTWKADAKAHKDHLDRLAEKYYGEGTEEADEETEELPTPEERLSAIADLIDERPSGSKLRDFVAERIGEGLSADDPRLVKLLEPFRGHFEGNEFWKLRAAFEELDKADEAADEEAISLVPDDWKWRDKLRRSRVVMIGGDERPGARERLERAFAPADFQWPSIERNESMRLIQSWAKRIERGSVDIVILLTEYVSHSVSGAIVEATKDAEGVELVYVDRGYGVEQIRRGIEHFVDPDDQPTARAGE